MGSPHHARPHAWIGAACAAAMLVGSAHAHAAEGGALGFALGLGVALGVAGAAAPYLAASDRNDPAPATLGVGLGAGRHLDGFAIGADLGGYLRRGGVLGWMGRTRMDLAAKGSDTPSYTALRIDSIALLRLAGDPTKPLLLEALPGLTIWPRIETSPAGKTRAYLGIGPTLGLRLRARSASPNVVSDLEVDYAPLFGAPPTGKLHHFELGSALGFSPWPNASGVLALELRARFEAGLGGADVTRTTGVSLLGGVRVRLDLVPKSAPPRP